MCLLKNFRLELFPFPMDTPYWLMQAISGLISLKSDSGLLVGPVILNNPKPTTKKTILDGTLLDLSGILTTEK